MARPELHSAGRILDAARTLVLDEGAGAATVGAIAQASGAPTGSLYHRFGSRDVLLARLWMRAVRRSQAPFVGAIASRDDPLEAAVAAALSVYDFAREERADARLLLSLRREDLVQAPLPPAVADELAALNRPVERAVANLARRLYGRATKAALEATALAVVDLPYGAIRRHLIAGREPPARLRPRLERAVRAVLEHEGRST
jgi:AcrR family transcriptional regulator